MNLRFFKNSWKLFPLHIVLNIDPYDFAWLQRTSGIPYRLFSCTSWLFSVIWRLKLQLTVAFNPQCQGRLPCSSIPSSLSFVIGRLKNWNYTPADMGIESERLSCSVGYFKVNRYQETLTRLEWEDITCSQWQWLITLINIRLKLPYNQTK